MIDITWDLNILRLKLVIPQLVIPKYRNETIRFFRAFV